MTNREAAEILKDSKWSMSMVGVSDVVREHNEAIDVAVDALLKGQIICKDCQYWNTVVEREKAEYGLCYKNTLYIIITTPKDGYCYCAERLKEEGE